MATRRRTIWRSRSRHKQHAGPISASITAQTPGRVSETKLSVLFLITWYKTGRTARFRKSSPTAGVGLFLGSMYYRFPRTTPKGLSSGVLTRLTHWSSVRRSSLDSDAVCSFEWVMEAYETNTADRSTVEKSLAEAGGWLETVKKQLAFADCTVRFVLLAPSSLRNVWCDCARSVCRQVITMLIKEYRICMPLTVEEVSGTRLFFLV